MDPLDIEIFVYPPSFLERDWHRQFRALLRDALTGMGFSSYSIIIASGNSESKEARIEANCHTAGSVDADFALRIAQTVCHAMVNISKFAPGICRVLGPAPEHEMLNTWEIQAVPSDATV